MATIEKKLSPVQNKKHPLDRKFKTIDEAAKAKTDYLLNEVLKGYDLNKLKK
ncbi:hypothetical protein [Dyadobacter sp. NIV53]|uniref:hypothetical protein n=1 Tax=Dyadobacter sp. NIV53 TaxID=2861765 RepID=UPI001C883766|nr:hypothetical protein [Dyadobacter sp. NIV53]